MKSQITSEFLRHVYEKKIDFTPDDFRIMVGSNMLPITPEIIAEMFACLSSEEQAAFFNHIDKIASSWHGGGFEFQLQAITDEDGLTLAGRRVMQSIGDYSHWGLVPKCREVCK